MLQKLIWYRKGDCVSDRQWRDVVGVLKRCGGSLEGAYLERWSSELELEPLLAKALRQAGLPERLG